MRPEDIKKAGYYPVEEITEGQPFPAGTGGCASFRIPALIRLADGGLFAATDARWTSPDDDFGGIDTIYAVSDDGGAHWRHGYAAYFPDSLGSPKDLKNATICIDPMPVQTPDGVIRIFVNLNPTGVSIALRWPGTGTGFTEIGGVSRLALTDDYARADDDPAAFPFYLGASDGGFAPILRRAGGDAGFAADGFFNLYRRTADGYVPLLQRQTDTGREIVQNLFYKDALFHVYNTTYTLQLASADGARTWSCELVSDRVKLPDESAVIAAPGHGLVTAAGRTVLPFYTMTPERSASFLVFSDDCRRFARSPLVPASPEIPWSGEGKPVELPDGAIRLFFRNRVRRICYADYHPETNAWDAPVALPVTVHSDCNFGALALGGRILIAYARGVGPEARTRSHGRLYVFRLDEKQNMLLADVLPITEDAFSYAVLARTGPDAASVLYDTCGDGIVRYLTLPPLP